MSFARKATATAAATATLATGVGAVRHHQEAEKIAGEITAVQAQGPDSRMEVIQLQNLEDTEHLRSLGYAAMAALLAAGGTGMLAATRPRPRRSHRSHS